MAGVKTKVSPEKIESFLNGTNPQKYIVAIETTYHSNEASLIVNDPISGKRIEKHKYSSFCWFKEDVKYLIYGGSHHKISEACKRHGVKLTKLITSDENGLIPERLDKGFKFMATCTRSYNELTNFFKNGGLDIFEKGTDNKKYFTIFSPTEQFMLQSKKRLFKGFDDYDNLHRFQFDLETEGLFASVHAINQIGIKDNKGNNTILETIGNTLQEKRDSERVNIEKFFKAIDILKPDIIAGYNSENFDWDFLFKRCDVLFIPITDLAITLNDNAKIKRKQSPIKYGGNSDDFMQTMMWGYNIIDISHAVRRAQAINSEIKKWNLKYITKYSEIAKHNRVYIPGDKINLIWGDKVNNYAFNNVNGDWYKITDKKPLKDEYEVVTGNYLVQRYLEDDLWETEEIDNIFNQASFLIGKILPTTFQRSSTMGTASQWKLIMAAWSYENGLALPSLEDRRNFTGGLSRLLSVGYSEDFVKLDYAGLYPKTELTHDIFPDLDITGVMKGMLTYIVETRDKFKALASDEKKIIKKLKKEIELNKYTGKELQDKKDEIDTHKAKQNLYDKKQLPLKILANSWFGSYGAPYIFNWGETNCAEETTCRGRQYLRHMVRFFKDNYNFRPLVLDTDGCNFEFPKNINETAKYTAKGTHWKTKGQKGVDLIGLEAALADFNENHLPADSYMGLDIDDIGRASINLSRKNYANDIDNKIKLVGNSIKNSKMPVYIEEFLDKGIKMLLANKGYEFIEYYYEYVDKIYGYSIPLVKIASKSKVTTSISEYKKKATQTNKKGNPLPKQAHMELAIRDGLAINKGDMLYYVNTGASKSCGDLKTDKNKVTGVKTLILNCKLIDPMVIESDNEMIKELEVLKKSLSTPEKYDELLLTEMKDRLIEIEQSLSTDEYNASKYLSAFNKKVKPLLVCFDPSIRKDILLDVVKIKDKKTKIKTEKLKERNVFTKEQCKLTSGHPYKDKDQDTYEALMTMEDKEIKFWDSVTMIPNYMDEAEWANIRLDYIERKRIEKEEGVAAEKIDIIEVFKRLDVNDYHNINLGITPADILRKTELDGDDTSPTYGYLISRKWDEPLCYFDEVYKFRHLAIDRDVFYKEHPEEIDGLEKHMWYDKWVLYNSKKIMMTGNTTTSVDQVIPVTPDDLNKVIALIIENLPKTAIDINEEKIKEAKKLKTDNEDEDDEEDTEANPDDGIIIGLDDDVDDTFTGPDDDEKNIATPIEEIKSVNMPMAKVIKEEPKQVANETDEWGF